MSLVRPKKAFETPRALETHEIPSIVEAYRKGLHIAPRGDSHDTGDSDLASTFGYVAREVGRRRIAFLFAREGLAEPRLGPTLKAAFGGPFIANQGLTLKQGAPLLQSGEADAIAWGQQFIANPDLPERSAKGAELNTPDADTFYADGSRGYADYPSLATVAG